MRLKGKLEDSLLAGEGSEPARHSGRVVRLGQSPCHHISIYLSAYVDLFIRLYNWYAHTVSIICIYIYIYIQHKDSKDLRVVEAGASPVRPGRIAAWCLAVEEHVPQLHREDEPGAQPPFFKDAPQKKVQTV